MSISGLNHIGESSKKISYELRDRTECVNRFECSHSLKIPQSSLSRTDHIFSPWRSSAALLFAVFCYYDKIAWTLECMLFRCRWDASVWVIDRSTIVFFVGCGCCGNPVAQRSVSELLLGSGRCRGTEIKINIQQERRDPRRQCFCAFNCDLSVWHFDLQNK